MTDVNSMSTLAGNFKEIYGEYVIPLAGARVKLAKMIPFTEQTMVGNKYHQPVDLTYEHGLTAAAASAGTVTLVQPVAGQMQDAQVEGAQLFARSQVDYETIYRAQQAGKKAFADSVRHVVNRLTISSSKDLEIQLIHGRRGIGYVSAKSGAGTTRVYTIADASWSAAIWSGMENATLDFFKADFSGVKLNALGPVVVTAVDLDLKTISVSGVAGDLTAIDAEQTAPTGGAFGPQIFRETHSPTTEMAGIDAIIRNTGILFNINATTYSLWKGNVLLTTGSPTLAKVLRAVARCVERGLGDKAILDPSDKGARGALAIVSSKAFEEMNSDQAALRRYDAKYSSDLKNGFEGLQFYSQAGIVEILAHPYQKDGLIHVVDPSIMKRVGATDLTFLQRGSTGKPELIRELPDKGASEMRAYSNQALFIEKPAQCAVLDGVTYPV